MARKEDLDYQRKIKDESVNSMHKIVIGLAQNYDFYHVDFAEIARELFDAIKRGEIPHIKVEQTSNHMSIINTEINHGGLLRCCVQNLLDTLQKRLLTHEESNTHIGEIISCPHCQGKIILDNDHIWRRKSE